MGRIFRYLLLVLLFVFSPGVEAQDLDTDVGLGPELSQKKYMEIQSQLEAGLPTLLENIKDSGTLLKAGQKEESLAALKRAQNNLKSDEKVLTKESQYREIAVNIDKIESSLETAERMIETDNKPQAMKQLAEAYRRTKSLAESPVLKLAATEIALNNASAQIRGGNYRGAGLFLQQAVDNLSKIQNDPNINSAEIKKLKNDIIITQQQVVMGELKDEKKLNNFYPGLAAARVNTLNSYYSVWNRNDMPWDLY